MEAILHQFASQGFIGFIMPGGKFAERYGFGLSASPSGRLDVEIYVDQVRYADVDPHMPYVNSNVEECRNQNMPKK